MAAKPLPSQDVLNQLLRYDPETGKLFWKTRPPELFRRANSCNRWNGKHAGKEAFTAMSKGYAYGAINNVLYLGHRLIFKMVTGEDPDQIDHINGNPSDNRIENLRSVNGLENNRNAARPSHNTSGHTGVSFIPSRNKWEAYITLGNTKINLGRFNTRGLAIAARRAAETEHGFHSNHGRN